MRELDHDAVTDSLRVRQRVGYMPEHDCLPPQLTATDLVSHLGRLAGLPRAAARERTAEMLRHVGLYEERYGAVGGSTGWRAAPASRRRSAEKDAGLPDRGATTSHGSMEIAPSLDNERRSLSCYRERGSGGEGRSAG